MGSDARRSVASDNTINRINLSKNLVKEEEYDAGNMEFTGGSVTTKPSIYWKGGARRTTLHDVDEEAEED